MSVTDVLLDIERRLLSEHPDASLNAWDYATQRIGELGHTCKDIRGPRRFRPWVLVRVKISQELEALGHSYPVIAHALGRKNHTSIMWYCGNVKGRRPPRRALSPCYEDHVCKDSAPRGNAA